MINPTTATVDTEQQSPINGRILGGAFALLTLIYLAGFAVGGELGQIALAGVYSLPFTLLAVLAYIGVDRIWGKVLAIGWLLLLLALVFLNGFFNGFIGLMEGSLTTLAPGTLPEFQEGALGKLLAITGLSLLAVLVSMLAFLPGVRLWFRRFLPIDPHSFVHAIALVSVVGLTLLSIIPLIVLNAPPTLLAVAKLTDEGMDITGDRGTAGQLLSHVYRLSWIIPGAILAVGYAIRRNLRQALDRLGFVRPSLKQVLLGIASAAALVAAATTLGYAMDMLWEALGWPTTDAEAFGELIAFAINPIGAIVIGITAGIGEELGVRGVLQPRLGIVLSNIFFIALHASQYHWNTLLTLFFIGLAFGVLRKRTNTTTSAITHGTYDFILIMLAVFEVPLFSE